MTKDELITKRKTIPKKTREHIYLKYNKMCQYCGEVKEFKDINVDHITPFSYGGECKEENYILACRECNNYKYHFTPSEWKEHMLAQLLTLKGQRNFKFLVKFGLITVNDDVELLFEFEKGELIK